MIYFVTNLRIEMECLYMFEHFLDMKIRLLDLFLGCDKYQKEKQAL